MLGEQTCQVACADSQPFSQPLHAAAIELPLLDEGQRAFDGRSGAFPCRTERRCFRAASQARTEAGVLGRGRATIKRHVAGEWRARRADGTTIDARCSHRDEYHAVQRCVAAAEGIVVGVEVEHGARYSVSIFAGRV
ncbi:hypothetical protein ACM42_34905 [Bradyrhizobium sp. CCBAU 25338]|nr:hypothetical protein [Bradyrhizobium sp. CCBAU 25338]